MKKMSCLVLIVQTHMARSAITKTDLVNTLTL